MYKTFRVGMALIALVLMGSWYGRVDAAPAMVRGQEAFELTPGGSATITFESFCLDYGKKFPTAVGLPPTQVAEANVVGALNYALGKDYTTSAPKEVQFAVWNLRSAQGSPAVGAQGDEVVKNTSTAPSAPAGATSVIDALRDNRIRATAGTWAGVGEQITIGAETTNFQGRGELKIENSSQDTLTLYMPTGTIFPAPSAEFQSMAGYAVDVVVNNPQQLPNTGVEDVLGLRNAMLALFALAGLALGITMRRRVAL